MRSMRVKPGRWLVQEQDARVGNEGNADVDTLGLQEKQTCV